MRTAVGFSTPGKMFRKSHSFIVMFAHVLVVGVVGVDEGRFGLGVVIVLILVLLGLPGLKLDAD